MRSSEAPRHPRRAGARRRLSAAACCTLAASLLNACYGYVPAPQEPAPRASVRVTLTDAGTAALVGVVGPSIESVDGQVLSADADSIVVGVTQTTTRRGVEADWRGERIAVPRGAVATVQVRRLSRARTALAVAGAAALLVGSAIGFNLGSDSPGAGGRVPPAPQ